MAEYKRQPLGLWSTVWAVLIATTFHSCGSIARDKKVNKKLDRLLNEKPVVEKVLPLELITRNVIGNSTPETFYERDGIRSYVTIDGRAVDNYFPLQVEIQSDYKGGK